MTYTFVTSFHKKHEDVYARMMLESVAKNWKPSDTKLIAYVEGYDSLDELPLNNFDGVIEYRHIESIDARNNFIERNKDKNGNYAEAPYNYRMDALRFCHKVYALTDVALEMLDNQDQGWLAWIDADTVTKKMFKAEDAAKIMIPEVDIVHLGRIDIDYSETGFMAFNMAYHNAASLLIDLRGAYDTDEVFGYREWTDAFIFTRLLKIYEAHGAKVRNLSEGVRGLSVFDQCMLDEYFVHNKGNLKFDVAAVKEKANSVSQDVTGPGRYKQLATLVRHYSKDKKVFIIAETGTWNGGRAIEMALAAYDNVDEVHYMGFDLFEQATDETDKLELNIKAHNSEDLVNKRLDDFSQKMLENGKTFSWNLYAGNTNETMEQVSFDKVDFAFIDGGHSYDTVQNDYGFLRDVDVVVFDDFYSVEKGKEMPEEHKGIIKTIEEIKDRNKKVLPSQDGMALGGNVHLAVVTKPDVKNIPKELSRVPIIIKPKDSMPQDHIKDNIRYNVPKIGKFDWVKNYKPTNDHAIVVSGGTLDFKEIKKIQKKTGGKIWCVKHAYPRLLAEGIKPYACVILDPRPIEGTSTHGIVRTELFKEIDPSTLFIIASMTDTSVVNYIMDKTDNVMGFHAFTDGIRDEKIKDKLVIDPSLPIPNGTALVSGGTASATRTLGLLETLGYRNIHMFGFDCSVPEKVAKKNQDSKDEAGNPKYMHVEINDVNYWTTGELLALAQDLEKMLEKKDLGLNLKFYGENSLARGVWDMSHYSKNSQTFKEYMNARS
jgi:hypothetical protein